MGWRGGWRERMGQGGHNVGLLGCWRESGGWVSQRGLARMLAGEERGGNMAQRLWKGIKDSTKGWTIVTEQTVAGLQGLPQPEEQIDAWQRAEDEVDDLHLEGKEVQADADMAAQWKRPDA